jgi:hypothetical protein
MEHLAHVAEQLLSSVEAFKLRENIDYSPSAHALLPRAQERRRALATGALNAGAMGVGAAAGSVAISPQSPGSQPNFPPRSSLSGPLNPGFANFHPTGSLASSYPSNSGSGPIGGLPLPPNGSSAPMTGGQAYPRHGGSPFQNPNGGEPGGEANANGQNWLRHPRLRPPEQP